MIDSIGLNHLVELTGVDYRYKRSDKYADALNHMSWIAPPFRNAVHAVICLAFFGFGLFFSGMFLFFSGIHTGDVRLWKCIVCLVLSFIFTFHGVTLMMGML